MKIFSTDGYKYFSISYLYLILQIAATGTNFLLTPLMISRTDATQFKGWAIINALGQLMLLSDWGFLNRYRVDMTTYFEKAQKFPRELWSSVLKIMKFSSIFGFLIMTIIGLFSLKLMNYMTGEYALCLILALLSNFATLYEHVFLIKYQSINREDTILRILIVCRINEIALQVIVLLFSGKLIVLYASMLLSRILVLLLISTRKTIREIEIDVSEIKTQMRVFEDQDLSGIFFVISNLIYTNLLTLIVAKILPTNQFIIFQIARLIAAPTRMIGSALAIGTAQKDLRNSFEFSEHQDRNQIKETLAALSFLVSFGLFSSFFGPTIWNFFFRLMNWNGLL